MAAEGFKELPDKLEWLGASGSLANIPRYNTYAGMKMYRPSYFTPDRQFVCIPTMNPNSIMPAILRLYPGTGGHNALDAIYMKNYRFLNLAIDISRTKGGEIVNRSGLLQHVRSFLKDDKFRFMPIAVTVSGHSLAVVLCKDNRVPVLEVYDSEFSKDSVFVSKFVTDAFWKAFTSAGLPEFKYVVPFKSCPAGAGPQALVEREDVRLFGGGLCRIHQVTM